MSCYQQVFEPLRLSQPVELLKQLQFRIRATRSLKLRLILRTLDYRKAKKKCSPLPKGGVILLLHGEQEMYFRRIVAERMVLLQHGVDPFRYSSRNSVEAIGFHLEKKHHWLLNPTALPNLEWAYFVCLVGYMTSARSNAEPELETLLEGLAAPLEKPTARNITAAGAAEEIETEGECGIRMLAFSHKDRAVRTKCGHIQVAVVSRSGPTKGLISFL